MKIHAFHSFLLSISPELEREYVILKSFDCSTVKFTGVKIGWKEDGCRINPRVADNPLLIWEVAKKAVMTFFSSFRQF